MSPSLLRGTLRALLEPRRALLILIVAAPLLLAQSCYSPGEPLAVPLGALMCLLFVTLAPLSYRVLFPEPVGFNQGVVRLLLFAAIGCGVVLTVGAVIPKLFDIGFTFLTRRPSLVVCAALFVAGGWGLGRDIGLEASLLEARRRAELAQLLALRTHLDPHFLFNTLNAIAEWCREDGEVAERAVLQLSSMLRDLLGGIGRPSWPLESELALVRTLFALHLLRDPERFTYELQVAPEQLATPVPPLLLLPLAENAVKHGPARGQRGRILVTARADADVLRITLENPGEYRGPRAGSGGVPVVERRLALAYGGAAHLSLAPVPEDAKLTRASLELPLTGPLVGALT